jgi:hypothetical protein
MRIDLGGSQASIANYQLSIIAEARGKPLREFFPSAGRTMLNRSE